MEKHEHLKFIIDRFDKFYDAANNKGSFYIALNTFILGGICVGSISLKKDIEVNDYILILTALLLSSCFVSIFFTIRALIPFLKDSSYSGSPSLIYFAGVAKRTLPEFETKFNQLTDPGIISDLTHQAHCLATGLQIKYTRLKYAGWTLVFQFVLLAPLLLLIFKNYKP
jgi:hypothetical protein